jgi:hypothetical protein
MRKEVDENTTELQTCKGRTEMNSESRLEYLTTVWNNLVAFDPIKIFLAMKGGRKLRDVRIERQKKQQSRMNVRVQKERREK